MKELTNAITVLQFDKNCCEVQAKEAQTRDDKRFADGKVVAYGRALALLKLIQAETGA